MSSVNARRPRRIAGHRPSGAAGSRPRTVADSRRVAVRERPAEVPAPRSRRSRPRATYALAALVGVAVVVVGLLAWDLGRIDDRADARKAAQVVAADSVERILSYDHARYDQGVATAERLMTAQFAEEYADTVDTVRPEVLETESVVKAQVVASSVVSAEEDRVRALLFVNQTTTGTQVTRPRVDLNRVVVTLKRDDEAGWLVADLDAL